MRLGYDAAFPPVNPPAWAWNGFYIGGDTPHVWTDEEIHRQPTRWSLPIWVRTPTNANPNPDTVEQAEEDFSAISTRLNALGIPKGKLLSVDTETWNPFTYLVTLASLVARAGWFLLNYGSLSFVVNNPPTNGGRWSADWRDIKKIDPGHNIKITQYADSVMLGTDYDGNLAEDVTGSGGFGDMWDRRAPLPNYKDEALSAMARSAADLSTASALVRAHMA